MFDDDIKIDRALRSFAERGLRQLFDPKRGFLQRHGERVPDVEDWLSALRSIQRDTLSEAGFKTPEQAQRARVKADELLGRLQALMERHARHEAHLLALRRSAERIGTLRSEMRAGAPLHSAVERSNQEARALKEALEADG